MRPSLHRPVLLAVSLGISFNAVAKNPSPALGDLRKVGAVKLPTSCSKAVQKDFEGAVALLHSFFYEEARRRFTSVAEKDPSCAMAQWGIAMTLWHPLWTPPTEAELKQGTEAAEKAGQLAAAKATPYEKGFIDAIRAYYRPPSAAAPAAQGQSCHGPTGGGDFRARAVAYEAAMAEVHKANPKDVEAAAFYALGLMGSATPTDKTLANQTRAAALLEKHFAQKKNHPGLAHYLIHAYDYPSTAPKGLPAARLYANIAPWVPHVLHMPSHIFTRLGMWKDVVDSNLASAAAARSYAEANHRDATSFEELHALDYLVYGYLQTAQDEKAREVVAKAGAVKKTYPEIDMVSAYALGAIPARFALERRQWEEAAALPVPSTPSFTKFAFGEAHVEFARALGAARAGKVDVATRGIERLKQLREAIKDPRFEYFGKQLDMQRVLAEGFLLQAQGKKEEAVKKVTEAADADDALGKHPVSPGSMYPARELLGDLLMEQGAPADALTQYEASLKLNPGRFTGTFGAARAAELSGKSEVARRHYADLLKLSKAGDGKRPELATATAFLAKFKNVAGTR
jgi:tetratricopeptide (TPR) repeat protein